ncbi:hypothetical protein LCGC14_0759690 [marine sediment metagenome]|uniref:Phage protein n=1 Tax=marine sediment metagenome TaxID=412755 RepID=A0A0F9Q1M1_9ZZZZ
MAKTHAFKVKKDKDSASLEFKMDLPKTMDDMALIITRYGSVERMIDRANGQCVVDVAPGMRKRLPNVEDAQAYAAGFCDNGSKDAFVAPKISFADAKDRFDDSQMEWLKSQGMVGPELVEVEEKV